MIPLTNPLLFPIILFVISWIDWYVYGKKGMALLNRSPWLMFWSCLEVLLGIIMGYGFFSAYTSKSLFQIIGVIIASVSGCALGCWTSGVIKRKK